MFAEASSPTTRTSGCGVVSSGTNTPFVSACASSSIATSEMGWPYAIGTGDIIIAIPTKSETAIARMVLFMAPPIESSAELSWTNRSLLTHAFLLKNCTTFFVAAQDCPRGPLSPMLPSGLIEMVGRVVSLAYS